MPHDVFISYSSIDKAAADAACATFEAAGIRCWIAPRDVVAGSEWAEAIITAIEGAKVMVLIFSSNSNDSRQVRREIELAVNRGLTIMPVRLEAIEPTRSMAYYMAGVHWLDALTPPLDAHLKRLVDWIRPHLKGKPPPEAPPRPRAAPKPKAETRPAAPLPEKAKSPGWFDIIFGRQPESAAPTDAPPPATPKTSPLGIDMLSKMFQAGLELQRQGRHQEAIAAYRKLIAEIDGDERPLYREQMIRSFYNEGNALAALNRHQEAIASFDEALRRAKGREEEGIRETVARILFNRAHSLDNLNRKAEAIKVYDEVIERYGADVDGMGHELAGRALFTKGVLTGALGREDEAIALYEHYLRRYGDEAVQLPYVAEAMFNIGAAHGVKRRSAEAVAAYDLMLARFRGASEPAINEFVAMALYNRGNRLSDLKQPAQAIESYDELIASFGDDPRMPDRIAKAMINRANQLGVMGRKKDANTGYEAVITKFAGSSNKDVQAQMDNARKWKS